MPDPDTVEAWLGVVALALGIAGSVLAAIWRWMISPLLEIRDGFRYHLEPNGTESPAERRRRRPQREIALGAERDIAVIKERQTRDYEWRQEHDRTHARHGIE